MLNLLKASSRLTGTLFAAGVMAFAQGGMAQPGALNYTEGQVSIDGQAVKASRNAEVQPGQVLETQDGKAEMLLTPGVFLRLNNQSQARMVSSSITDTRVELLKGEAIVEAAQVEKENNIGIIDGGVNSQITKRGIYQFNANQPKVAVYDGELIVQNNDRTTKVKKGHQLTLVADANVKPQKFDTDSTDGLYSWSKLRSEYMAEANMSTAQTIVVNDPAWFYGTGWYWNPYFSSWAFVPGGGYFYSPFGFGFYSPGYWGGYYGRGIIGRGYWGGGHYVRPVNPAPALRRPAPAFSGSPAPHMSAPVGRGFGGGHMGGGHFGGRR